MILIRLSMSSPYSIDAPASSGRTGTPHQHRVNGSVLVSRRGSIPVSAIALLFLQILVATILTIISQ